MSPPISAIVGGCRKELADMTWDEYLAFPALNGSCIVKGLTSMLHLHYAWSVGQPDTDAMQFGRLMHCLLFEPRHVEQRYRAWDGRRAGKDYQAFCALAEAEGAEVVKATGQYSMESALDASIHFFQRTRVRELIAAGEAEKTVLCPEADIQCKGRLDWVSTSEHVLTDLKTAAEIDSRLFGTAFFRYAYDIKLGLYQRWLQAVTGEPWPVEVILLESKPPHDVAVVPIPHAVLDQGVDRALRIIEKVRGCIETGEWPGVAGDELYPLHVPIWQMEEDTTEPFGG